MDSVLSLLPLCIYLQKNRCGSQRGMEDDPLDHFLCAAGCYPLRPNSLRRIQTPVPPLPADPSSRFSGAGGHRFQPAGREIRFYIQSCRQHVWLGDVHRPAVPEGPVYLHDTPLRIGHRIFAHLSRAAFRVGRCGRRIGRNRGGVYRLPDLLLEGEKDDLPLVAREKSIPAMLGLRGQYRPFVYFFDNFSVPPLHRIVILTKLVASNRQFNVSNNF